MRIYQLSWNDRNQGTMLSWHASKQEAKDVAKHVELEEGGSYTIDVYDIPATKAGMIRWLNVYFTTDNG